MKRDVLKNLADIQTGPFGSQLHQEDYKNIGSPIVTVEHLGKRNFSTQNLPLVSDEDKERLNKYVLKTGDTVFSRVGSVDRCSYVGREYNGWLFSGRCLRVRPLDQLDSLYLYYFFCLEETKQFIRNIAVGATMPSINTKLLGEVEISYPVIEEQRKIASILSTIDSKIEENEKINNNLEQQAKSLYQEMFLSNPSPEWKEKALSDIADITMGQSPNGESYNENGIGTIFYQGRAEFGDRFPTQRLFTTEPKRMARENDILMSVRAPVGDLNIAREDCCIGRGLAAIRSKHNKQSFLLYTLFSIQSKLNVFNSEGTVFGSINRDSLNNMPVLVPDAESIAQFESIVSPMDAQIRNNHEEYLCLSKLRDTLLPKLMSGELDVSDIDI